MYVVICKIDHCIHIHWCIVMGLGHNDPWVESHMWPQQTWGQRSSRGQWPLVQVFGKKGQCIHILWCIFKSNITMIAKVCDRESRRDSWFENCLVLLMQQWSKKINWQHLETFPYLNYTCTFSLHHNSIKVPRVPSLKSLRNLDAAALVFHLTAFLPVDWRKKGNIGLLLKWKDRWTDLSSRMDQGKKTLPKAKFNRSVPWNKCSPIT